MRSVLFFLFKQKTAYVVRISDWSADVCSSDLHVLQMAAIGFHRLAGDALLVDQLVVHPVHETVVPVQHIGETTGHARAKVVSGDRKRVVMGKSVSVRVAIGGRRLHKKKKYAHNHQYQPT